LCVAAELRLDHYVLIDVCLIHGWGDEVVEMKVTR